jgi:hypothetical protein
MYRSLFFAFRLDVNVSTILDDKFYHISVVDCCGNMKGRTTKPILMIDVGACKDTING